MNVSVNWISDLLGREIDPQDAAQRLTMLGAAVESIDAVSEGLDDVIVALVARVEKHPNADRLILCHVNDGNAVVEVVCGARNVTAGGKYAYAPVGTELPGGVKLSARKIRGIKSNGMLCSPSELGLGADHEGILELRTDAAPGTPLTEAMQVTDTRLDVEVTANRPDLLGHKGIARELGAVYGAAVKLPAIPEAPPESAAPRHVATRGTVDGVEVTIEDVEGCPRYMAAVLRGVKIGPSPTWLEARLRAVGARPINNVVDATNYILYELNQPLHAFDLNRLRGGKVIIRRALPGEHLVTLDGEKRELTPEMTMICDAEGATAVAGVMGGAASEVVDETTDILLECAYFDRRRIRATRQALKMSSEASYRFERGTDIEAMPDSIRRAVALIRAVAGGKEREPPLDVYPKPFRTRSVFLRPERAEHLLGTPISREEIERLLVRLGFAVAPKGDRLHVQIPGWRPDVSREVDLIEEIARLKGYDAFPVELRPFRTSAVPDDPAETVKARVRRVMTSMGLNEARSLSLTGSAASDAVRVLNPLSAEESFLRRDLLGGLVRSAERNWATRERNIRLFEIGRVFRTGEGPLPEETLKLAAVISGARTPPHWSNAGKPPDYDLWDLKAMFEEAVRVAGPAGAIMESEDGWVLKDQTGEPCGWAGVLSADAPAWAAALLGFEMDVDVRDRLPATYNPLATTPPVERDVALVLPEGVSAMAVEAAMRQTGGSLLADLRIFDEYRGRELGGRSVAWRLVFRAPDRTLRDEEADAALTRMLTVLKEQFGVERRQA
ncbi:MAG: phenylalanine--tRNA ligase subunit beta [Gemmatimonadales bacterium]|nr:phenylalanine--tRNA ligase subunit beta [Gemmatimonadales bacterium]NIN12220.1 phenylalanine--tRNA ligase subunit beta [Gemmatimonadales bacterium]NIN50635.1 phenylalanine--tRNA ligase subunit beta [Gemmatimonadales bacterium]NIP08099.1 phenylalanine--tRNA ligase subunit beta [Gemmatimonadales bacterium]NIR03389.1 phenylalanine--tRNA ligase subunit beta [Gemmatimonadales bacterium]